MRHSLARLSAGPDERALHGAFAVAQLFTHRRATGTVLIWTVYFMNLLNLYFLNSWLPTMISDADVPVATAIRLTALFQVGGIGGALVLGAILDRVLLILDSRRLLSMGRGLRLLHRRVGHIAAVARSHDRLRRLRYGRRSERLPRTHGRVLSHDDSLDRSGMGARDSGRIGSIVGPVLGGLLLARGTPVGRVFWAAAIPALIATLAAAGIASITRGDPK